MSTLRPTRLALAHLVVAFAWLSAVPTRSAHAAARAVGGSSAPAAEMVDLLVRAGRAFSARRFEVALRLYHLASSLDPRDGQPLVMAGVAAYQSHAPGAARRDLNQALRRRLSPEDRELAVTYLGLIADDSADDAVARAPAATADPQAGWSASLTSSLGGGYDSNARQGQRGVLENETVAGDATGALFASAGVEAGLEFSLDPRTEVELGLGVDQSVYPAAAVADLSSQEHAFSVAVSHRPRPDLRLRAQVGADLSFAGVGTRLQPFQSSFRFEPQLVLGSGAVRLRLAAAWQGTNTQDPALSYLTGQRLEATVTPTLTLGGWIASLTARGRRSDLGTERSAASPTDDPLCPTCTRATVGSHANRSLGAAFFLSGPARWRVRPTVSARWELRVYDQAQLTETETGSGVRQSDPHLRRDEQLAVGAGAAVRLAGRLTLGLRYSSNGLTSVLTPLDAAPACGDLPCADATVGQTRGYRKHALTADLTVDWL